jgi:ribA/ribD-fused uncharacterized protein
MISSFSGEYRFLSNFYQAQIVIERRLYPDVEHYFQCCKATSTGDFAWVLDAVTAAEAKKRGRQIKCHPDWDAWKRQCMLNGVLAKFSQHPDLRDQLAATGGEVLVEGNTWGDTYWGAVAEGQRGWSLKLLETTDEEIEPFCGLNYLGRILMAVRMVLC